MTLEAIQSVLAPPDALGTYVLSFAYKNWRGQASTRTVLPKHIWYGALCLVLMVGLSSKSAD
jgi:hypothetical protein